MTKSGPVDDVSQAREGSATISASNLAVICESEATAEVKLLFDRYRFVFGRAEVPGILRCFATHPVLLEHMIGLADGMLFSEGALGREWKELLATFVSSGNRCAYCADSHGFFLRVNGGTEEALEAALACDLHSQALPMRTQSWLRFVAKVSNESFRVTPQDVEALRGDGWSDLQIAETIHLTALFAAFNRVVNAFGLPSQGLIAKLDRKNAEG